MLSMLLLPPPTGLESVYFWEGKVQSDAELLLKIKTRKALLPQLTTAVQGLHPCVGQWMHDA